MTVEYTPKGVCSQKMTVSAEDGIITEAKIIGGCSGNSQGICRLVKGMTVEEAISRLHGIRCGSKASSCPDQLSIAIKRLLEADKSTQIITEDPT
ncbi:MAG: TIGR03905 family TSCPD domain-containing protein [Oscillospiraceae bacterium]|nr:TIGR03905 family TSCPD domain-containing protein [Oscillospiraceae bacterium]